MKRPTDSSQPARRGRKKTPTHSPAHLENHQEDQPASMWLPFARFGWDILGVILLSAALMTLLGLVGFTQGVFLSPWVWLLSRWFGWGSYLAAVFIGLLGIFSLRRRFAPVPRFRLGRILALEGWLFTAMTLLTIWGGGALERAEGGLDGGLIGWGLLTLIETYLPAPLSTVLLIVLLLYFTLVGLGITDFFAQRFEAWLLTARQSPAGSPEGMDAPAPLATAEKDLAGDQPRPLKTKRKGTPPQKPEKHTASETLVRSSENLPPLNLLMNEHASQPDEDSIRATAYQIEKTLAEFGVPARAAGYRVGPTVTQFAVEPGFVEKIGPDGNISRQKVRVSQISALGRDLALALSANRLRIEAPVPGQSFVGIEVPHDRSALVRLRPLLESEAFRSLNSPLAIALGRDVAGEPVVADLGRMPHLLIAGTTGSGKSVCITTLTACLVMNNSPSEVRLAMLDPKMVELARFNGLPHILGKVETETERMLAVLQWALAEMDRRYRLLETARARDLESYNRKMARRGQETIPRVVVLIDELADLMMTAPEQTEHSLVRLAQMARATGIHLVVATQRPSTDIVTGLIKANFPARVAFSVASSVDSRVILDENGAETLLGRGDMLFLNPEVGTPQRAQGAVVTDHEVERIIEFWKKLAPTEDALAPWEDLVATEGGDSDVLIAQAIEIVRSAQRASASLLQRRLHIGYPRAARLIDELEERGVVGPAQTGGREREVLLPPMDEEEADDDTAFAA